MVRHLCSLFKLRIGVAIMLSALAGLAVTPGIHPSPWQVVVLALSVLLSAGSAGALNHWIEVDLDRRMERTRGRPFASGYFPRNGWWLAAIWGLLAVAVGASALVLNAMVALHVFLGAFVYGIVYTVWLKRRTQWNIVVGGLAGSFAVLAGASAVDPHLSPAPMLLAVVLFLWTPPHFWALATALREEYAKAGVPMLPVVVGEHQAARIILINTVLLVVTSILPVFFGMGIVYLATALLGGGWFLIKAWAMLRQPSRKTAMATFFASLIQLCLLLAGAMIDGRITG